MKKIIFLSMVLSCFSVKAQVSKLFEQPSAYEAKIPSNYSDFSELGTFSTDDFNLAGQSEIESITVYGFQPDNNLEDLITGFSLYIYADVNGTPSGNPSLSGKGILEITNLSPSSPAFTLDHPGTSFYNFTVDITKAKGAPLTLAAGTYWIVAFPHFNMDASTINPNNEPRVWYWFLSDQYNLSAPQYIDPDNFLGMNLVSWTPMPTIFGPSAKALAFTIK